MQLALIPPAVIPAVQLSPPFADKKMPPEVILTISLGRDRLVVVIPSSPITTD
jgi:hypothetical protein